MGGSCRRMKSYDSSWVAADRRRLGVTDYMTTIYNLMPCTRNTERRKNIFDTTLCAFMGLSIVAVREISSYYQQKLKNEAPLTQPETLLMQEITNTQSECYAMAKLMKDDAPTFLKLMQDCNARGTDNFRTLKGIVPTATPTPTPTDVAGQQKVVKELQGKMETVGAALEEINPAGEGQQPGARRG